MILARFGGSFGQILKAKVRPEVAQQMHKHGLGSPVLGTGTSDFVIVGSIRKATAYKFENTLEEYLVKKSCKNSCF